eukprot:9890966-Alexandrium_andersonii.AAC.1
MSAEEQEGLGEWKTRQAEQRPSRKMHRQGGEALYWRSMLSKSKGARIAKEGGSLGRVDQSKQTALEATVWAEHLQLLGLELGKEDLLAAFAVRPE